MDDASRQKITKTKVRRMYDIANVLQAIGVLQKENVGSTSLQNKPSFRWVYPIMPQDMANYLGPGSQPASVQPGELMNVGGVAVPASLPEPHHVSPEELAAAQQAATLPSPLDAPARDEHTRKYRRHFLCLLHLFIICTQKLTLVAPYLKMKFETRYPTRCTRDIFDCSTYYLSCLSSCPNNAPN